jgi:predicted TIM-barrel fold metal-dependent hydrolase
MGFIDVDTHVIETDETWTYFDPKERHWAPATAQARLPYKDDFTTLWLVGDSHTRRHLPSGLRYGIGNPYDPDATTLASVSSRLAAMDGLGVDVQLLISSFFLGIEMDHPDAEAALARSYNRWMADRTAGSTDRLPWLLAAPTRRLERAMEELEFGHAHGAAGVLMKGMDHLLYLNDPYLFPLYQRAEDLGLIIAVHLGVASRDVKNLTIGQLTRTPAALLDHHNALMKGFYAVLTADFDVRFPNLRWVFLEGGATWVPMVFQQHQRLVATSSQDAYVETDQGLVAVVEQLPIAELMARKNLFVACESDEDLPYLTSKLGADQLVFGTDFGHNDVGSDPVGHTTIRRRSDIAEDRSAAITEQNGRRLLGAHAQAGQSAGPVGHA